MAVITVCLRALFILPDVKLPVIAVLAVAGIAELITVLTTVKRTVVADGIIAPGNRQRDIDTIIFITVIFAAIAVQRRTEIFIDPKSKYRERDRL